MNVRVGDLNQLDRELNLFNNNITNHRLSLDNVTNSRGVKLTEGFESEGLFLLNGRTTRDEPANFTFVNAFGGKSVINLIWTNVYSTYLIKELKVMDFVSNSDHFPVALSLIVKCVKNESRRKFKWKEDLVDDYRKNIGSVLIPMRSDDSVDIASKNLINTIKNVSKNLGMVSGIKKSLSLSKPWFDSECANSKKNL